MKILHTISNMGVKSGGTSTCTYSLLEGLKSLGLSVDVLSYKLIDGDEFPGEGDFFKTIELKRNNKFLYSRAFLDFLVNHSEYDIYHSNGLWQYPAHATAKYARKIGKNYVVTPHGMLYPDALKKSKWIKRIYSMIFQNKDLEKASAIHVTCMEELDVIRSLGIKTPIAVIPNAVSIKYIDLPIIPQNGKIRIGFLGRLHPRKKVESLILALAKLPNSKNIEIVVIGGGDDIYESKLRDLAKEKDLSDQIIFCGFLSGIEKDAAISSLSYLVVPSDFENFGMIIAEALVKGIPVIASQGTPWKELDIYNCGWWVKNDVDSLANIFELVLDISEEERIAMGLRGKLLIKDNYSIEIVAKQMMDLYEYLLNGNEKPDFVYL